MSTHAMDALGRLDGARKLAEKGDFEGARDDWTAACDSMANAKKWNEPSGSGSEYERALAEAERLLDEHGEKMVDAVEKERQRLSDLVVQKKLG